MTQSNDKANVLIDLWEILLRHRWRFIIPAFLVSISVLGVSLLLPRKYDATAVFEKRTDLVLAEIASRDVAQNFQNPRHLLTEEVAGPAAVDRMLKQIEPILDRYHWSDTPDERKSLREELIRRVSVRAHVQTPELDRVSVSFSTYDPRLAKTIVNQLVLNHIETARKQMDTRLAEAAGFFREEMDKSHSEIETLENKLLKFEIDHASLLPKNLELIQTEQSKLEAQYAELVSRRDALNEHVKSLTETLADEPQELPTHVHSRNPELVRLEELKRHIEDELRRHLKVLRMTDKHPDVINLRERLAEANILIAKTDQQVIVETQSKPNDRRANLQNELDKVKSQSLAATTHVEWLENKLATMKTENADLFAIRSEYRKLEQARNQANRQFSFWEENLRKVEMALTVEGDNRGIQLNFIQPAELNSTPVSPMFSQVLLGSLGLGMLAGVLSVFFAHRSDESFSDAQSLAHSMNLPLFGEISELITNRRRKLRAIRTVVLYPVHATVMATVLLALIITLHHELEATELAPLDDGMTHLDLYATDAVANDPATAPTRVLLTVEKKTPEAQE